MMRKLSSFVAKNCRCGRGFSSSASPGEGDRSPPVFIMAALTGYFGYIINDSVKAGTYRKRLRKTEEEADYYGKLYTENCEEYRKRSDELFGTKLKQ